MVQLFTLNDTENTVYHSDKSLLTGESTSNKEEGKAKALAIS
jgi:hypothetical protein